MNLSANIFFHFGIICCQEIYFCLWTVLLSFFPLNQSHVPFSQFRISLHFRDIEANPSSAYAFNDSRLRGDIWIRKLSVSTYGTGGTSANIHTQRQPIDIPSSKKLEQTVGAALNRKYGSNWKQRTVIRFPGKQFMKQLRGDAVMAPGRTSRRLTYRFISGLGGCCRNVTFARFVCVCVCVWMWVCVCVSLRE